MMRLGRAAICGLMVCAADIGHAQSSRAPETAVKRDANASLAIARRLVGLMRAQNAIAITPRTLARDTTAAVTRFESESSRAAGRWAERYLPADSVSEVSARVLAREFSEPELRELLSFYTSQIGKRFVDAQARLRTATNAETSRILSPHRQELQDTLRRIATHRP